MNKILAYLKKPASFNSNPLIVIINASLLVCFVLGIFQPFGIEKLDTTLKYYVIIGFTLVTAISTAIIGYLLPRLFKKFYDPSKWTNGRSLLNNIFIMLLISLGNFLFARGLGNHSSETSGSVFLSYMLITLLVGVIPALVARFIIQNYSLKENLNNARLMNEQLARRLESFVDPGKIETNIIILAGDTKEALSLYPDSILYIESSGNYVKVSYLSDNMVKQKKLRTTIVRIEKYLQNYPYMVRCHRAYIVNTSFINNVSGNSQGLQLNLRYTTENIPVSRSFLRTIRDRL